jgi:DNA-binding response OmpR family regulator
MTKPRILLIDDEGPMHEILSLYLRAKGMEVMTAANGHEARELLHKSPFDLTILDLNLGGEDGLEILDFLKSRWPDRPVIILTGLTTDEAFLRKTLAGRADGFMRKMSSLADLLSEVHRHLSTKLSDVSLLRSPGSRSAHGEEVVLRSG